MSYIGTKKIKSVYIGTNKVKSVYVGTNKVYSSETIEPYLTFTALQNDSTIQLKRTDKNTSGLFETVQYSTNGTTWTNFYFAYSFDSQTITLPNVGDKVYIRNTINTLSSSSKFLQIITTGKLKVSGNIMSMVNYSTLSNYCFSLLFQNSVGLVDASKLVFPSTTSGHCFESMFINCTSLLSTPELPATVMTENCYYGMFKNCTSLLSTPELPATSLADGCYGGMFENCTSLTNISQLPATTLASNCYRNMFKGCGSLVNANIILNAQTLVSASYYHMFYECNKLKVPPIINATTLSASYCCHQMFYSCSKLKVHDTQGEGRTAFFRTASSVDYQTLDDMFYLTGGAIRGTPVANTTYYYY